MFYPFNTVSMILRELLLYIIVNMESIWIFHPKKLHILFKSN